MNEKIIYIIEQFQKLKKAKLWNLGTDALKTWIRFANNIRKYYQMDNFNFSSLKIEHINDNYYKIKIGDKNVTPRISQNKKVWSKGAIRQFLQEGSFFGLIIFSPNDKIENLSEFQISASMANLLSKNFKWTNLVITSLINSSYSYAQHIRNFGFSLFFTLIMSYDENIFSKLNHNFNLDWKTHRQDNKKPNYSNREFNTSEKYVHICLDKLREKKTYFSLVKEIQNKYITIESIINTIYFNMYKKDENVIENYHYNGYDNSNNFLLLKLDSIKKKLQNERSKLREAIIKLRAYNLEKYSDITLDEEPLIVHTHASHIHEVKYIFYEIQNIIKENIDLSEKIVEGYINQASDPNNGLLLPSAIHADFDRNIFQFDINGKIIYQKENLDRIKALKIESAMIKHEVLNDHMIRYLKRRNTI